MPKAPKIPHTSADDTKKYHCDCERLCKGQLREVPYGTWRRHAGFRGPDTKGTRSLKEKRTHAGMASSVVQRASQGRSTTGGTSDIRRSLSLDRDPQLVQQDEQDHDPILEENHLADYDDFGNIPNTAPDVHPPISPPRHVIPQRSPSPDLLLPQPNDSVPAPLDADERVLMEDIYTHVKRDDLRHSLAFISRMRDVVSNTSPGSHSVDEVPQSQPMHVQVSTGSSSDSAQSSGESVTPLSDSVPLPSSSTLAFLATALNNASLEGSTSPHISPPSATSTGEVLTQPVKKKRGPTNPNNVFKPSSGSTTARNLCGIEWQAQRETGTVAEFTAHWNSLTLQQREPYIARSKLADAAKTNAAEFAVSGP